MPSDAEWCQMENFVEPGMDAGCSLNNAYRGTNAGEKLKDDVSWNGTNDYGFSVLKSGYYYWNGSSGYFWNTNENGQATGAGRFWSTRNNGSLSAYERKFYNEQNGIKRSIYYKEHGFSVRCIID